MRLLPHDLLAGCLYIAAPDASATLARGPTRRLHRREAQAIDQRQSPIPANDTREAVQADYEYVRAGTCNIVVAVEPQRGHRVNYWSAGVAAGCINVLDPRGTIQRKIVVPCRAPTMSAFAGTGAKNIFVTSLIRPHWDHVGPWDDALPEIETDIGGIVPQLFRNARSLNRRLVGNLGAPDSVGLDAG